MSTFTVKQIVEQFQRSERESEGRETASIEALKLLAEGMAQMASARDGVVEAFADIESECDEKGVEFSKFEEAVIEACGTVVHVIQHGAW